MKYSEDAKEIRESLIIIEDILTQFRINHTTSAQSAGRMNKMIAKVKDIQADFRKEFYNGMDEKVVQLHHKAVNQ